MTGVSVGTDCIVFLELPATATPPQAEGPCLPKYGHCVCTELLWRSQGLNLLCLMWGLSQVTSVLRKLLCASTIPSVSVIRNPLCCPDPAQPSPIPERSVLGSPNVQRTFGVGITETRVVAAAHPLESVLNKGARHLKQQAAEWWVIF